MKIYIIHRSGGEYEDRFGYNVAVFKTKFAAEKALENYLKIHKKIHKIYRNAPRFKYTGPSMTEIASGLPRDIRDKFIVAQKIYSSIYDKQLTLNDLKFDAYMNKAIKESTLPDHIKNYIIQNRYNYPNSDSTVSLLKEELSIQEFDLSDDQADCYPIVVGI